mgnify:CR=1 FL=1
MDDRIKLSYFYGKEAEQYSFYKIPKLLFTDDYFKKISVEAKVLYEGYFRFTKTDKILRIRRDSFERWLDVRKG